MGLNLFTVIVEPYMPYLYLKLLILRIQKIVLGIKISGYSVRINYLIDKIIWLHSSLKVLVNLTSGF